MPIHRYSQPNAQPLTTPNASIRIKECVLSQAVSSPIMSQIGLFLTKKHAYHHFFPTILLPPHKRCVSGFALYRARSKNKRHSTYLLSAQK